MSGNSPTVSSNQPDIHPDLESIVKKHLEHDYRRPFKQVSLETFYALSKEVANCAAPLIFDSGCGTGESTVFLAQCFREALVVGLEKSSIRIQKARDKAEPGSNLLFLRADLVDIWRLAQQAGWRLQRHFLLYPNPWPKKRHVRRRWHGHPVFKELLALGGILQVRSNWKIYVQEFARAAEIATGRKGSLQRLSVQEPISAFEKKYQASGHELLEYSIDLRAGALPAREAVYPSRSF
ncbi:MAG: tRNA (guanine(46)-N(7))-methyltransferase TrmB [bacterium]